MLNVSYCSRMTNSVHTEADRYLRNTLTVFFDKLWCRRWREKSHSQRHVKLLDMSLWRCVFLHILQMRFTVTSAGWVEWWSTPSVAVLPQMWTIGHIHNLHHYKLKRSIEGALTVETRQRLRRGTIKSHGAIKVSWQTEAGVVSVIRGEGVFELLETMAGSLSILGLFKHR